MFPAPAPADPYATTLSTLNLTDANGAWLLFVVDDLSGDTGNIAGGWSINITTSVTPTVQGDAGNNNFTLRANAGNNTLVDVVVDGTTRTFPKNAIATLDFAGQGGNDTLTIDYSNGNPVPAGGINFDGGVGGNDDLVVQGGPGFNAAIYNANNVGAGSLNLDGSNLTFSNLEPVTVTSAVGTVTVNIDPLDNINGTITTTISDDAGATMTVATDVGLESITFATPSVALIVNGDAIDSDTITIASVDNNAPYRAATTINGNGGGTDIINVNTALLLGSATSSGNLSLSANTVNLNGSSINTDAGPNSGSVTITGAAVLGNSVTIDTNGSGIDGAITFTSTLAADATANNRAIGVDVGGANVQFSGAMGANPANRPLDVVITNAAGVNFATDVNVSRDLTQNAGTGLTTIRGGSVGRNLSLTTDAITFSSANLQTNVVTPGTLNLNAKNAITIANIRVDANASPISVSANQDGLGSEDFAQLGLGQLLTTNGTTSAVNIQVGGTPGSGADARLNSVTAGATGRVTVTVTGGSIIDEAADIFPEIQLGGNVNIQSVVLSASDGIGTLANPFDIAAVQAEVSNSTSGGIFLTGFSGGLQLTNLVGPNAVDNGAGGAAVTGGGSFIRANSPLTIAANAITNSGAGNTISFTSNDSAAAGDDLTVNTGVTVQETTGSIVLSVGDNLVINTTATVRAAGNLTINLDTDAPAIDAAGSTARIFGTVRTESNVAGALSINGGANDDIIVIDSNGGALGDGGSVNNVIVGGGLSNFVVNGSGGTNELQLDDSGDVTADVFNITSNTITNGYFDLGGTLAYSSLATLRVQTSDRATGDGTQGDTVFINDLNPATSYFLDGNAPVGAGPNGPGDTLVLNPIGPITVYERNGNYVFEFNNSGALNVQEFETITLAPLNGVLNIVGDEGQGTVGGGAGVNETAQVQVIGTGVGAGSLRLSQNNAFLGVPPIINFFGVTDLNITTFENDDDVTIDPFASTIATWNIDVNVDSGAGDDDIFYGNGNVIPTLDPNPNGSVAGVSENVKVTPTLIPGAGEIAVPGVVTVHFQNTEDLSFLLNNETLGDTDTLTIEGVDSNLPDTFTVRPDAARNDAQPVVDLDITGVQILQIENVAKVAPGGFQLFATALNFNSLGGSDTFDVLPGASGTQLNINGGAPAANAIGGDTILIAAPANPANQVSVQSGSTNDRGSITSNLAGTARAPVNFTGIEGITVNNTTAATVIGTNGNNSITVTGTGANALTATVDGGPALQFNGVTGLQVNALSGDDIISLTQNTLNSPITVNGGDSTASDTLIFNNRPGLQDQLRFAPTANTSGNISGSNAFPTMAISSVEHLRVVLESTDTDYFTVDGTVGDDNFRITSGPNAGENTVTGIMNQGTGAFNLPEIMISGNSSIVIGTSNFNGVGGEDVTTVVGTDLNDAFTINRISPNSLVIDHDINGNQVNAIGLANLANLVIEAFNGDDTFNVDGNLPVALSLDGGNQSSSGDIFNFNGSGAGPVTQDYGNVTISESGFALYNYSGIEFINANAANANLTVIGTIGDDSLTVTPTGSSSAKVELTVAVPLNSDSPIFSASNVTVFRIDPVTGDNQLKVLYSNTDDQIIVNGPAGTLSNSIELQVNFNLANTEKLSVFGAEGNDTFTVTSAVNLQIFIDGGNPIGVKPGDVLVLTGVIAKFNPGPENDEGSFQQGAKRTHQLRSHRKLPALRDVAITQNTLSTFADLAQPLIYVLQVSNNSSTSVADVQITFDGANDLGITSVVSSTGVALNPLTSDFTFNLGTLSAGQVVTVTVNGIVSANAATALTNKVTVSIPGGDDIIDNNTTSATLPLQFVLGRGTRDVTATNFDGRNGIDLAVINEFSNDLLLLSNAGQFGFFSVEGRLPLAGRPRSIVSNDAIDTAGPVIAIADVGIGQTSGAVFVYKNRTLSEVKAGNGPVDLAIDRFNDNSIADLAVLTLRSNQLEIVLDESAKSLPIANVRNPVAVATADVDGRQLSDIVVASRGFETDGDGLLSVYLNDGQGGFSLAKTVPIPQDVSGLVTANIDGKGSVEIITASTSGKITVYSYVDGRPPQLFERQTLTIAPDISYIKAADITRDGRPELLVTNISDDSLSIFYVNASDQLVLGASVSGLPNPSAITTGDFDLDGLIEIIVPSYFVRSSNSDSAVTYTYFSSATRLNFATPLSSTSPSITSTLVATVANGSRVVKTSFEIDPLLFASPVERKALDTNEDQQVTPLDALLVINSIQSRMIQASGEISTLQAGSERLDVNRDGKLTPLDALLVINALNQLQLPSPESSLVSMNKEKSKKELEEIDFFFNNI